MIFNSSCLTQPHLETESQDLLICDPPFGINETSFDKHYNRDEMNVISGYVEAPDDYYSFSRQWISEAHRVLKPNGSAYFFSGWTNLRHILNAIDAVGFNTVNHIIWKYNFGVYTQKKYVSSHYHVLFLTKSKKAKYTFNTNCRFTGDDRAENGGSLLYRDLEDVFVVNKEYHRGEAKNQNKLPDLLVEKLILYSSNPGDHVCDFFLGNFTTAYCAKRLGRIPSGFEINPESYNYHKPLLEQIEIGGIKQPIQPNHVHEQGE